MSHAFKEYLQNFLEVYMDNLCIHSKEQSQHCLNPDKCIFMVRQGKIVSHIVSKNGISTDFEKIKIIVELPRP